MTWKCNAITHGLTIFPNNKIGPCCQIKADYLKSINEISNPNRFSDLLTETVPPACEKCSFAESNNLPSYREVFNRYTVDSQDKSIVFLDIRNTNHCNLKCRYCGPHFSNQWGKEIGIVDSLKVTKINSFFDKIITDKLSYLYFTGGEPLISGDHWDFLKLLIDKNISKNIDLVYNSNLTVLRYKNLDIQELWKNFNSVSITASFDAVGKVFENIRSNAVWSDVENNIKLLKKNNFVKLSVGNVLSILNVWHLDDFAKFCVEYNLPTQFTLLEGPDYLALDVIPDQFKELAIEKLSIAQSLLGDDNFFKVAKNKVINNDNQYLINHTISHVLLIDKLRNENMFDYLPFKDYSKNLILRNYEYE